MFGIHTAYPAATVPVSGALLAMLAMYWAEGLDKYHPKTLDWLKTGGSMTSILILNGPNLNLLGTRQPEIYGTMTLAGIEEMCADTAKSLGATVQCAQSNHEGVLVDTIHAAAGVHDGMVLNAGAFTHTSIALMDAIRSTGIVTVEMHLSNIHAREEFRQRSFIAPVALGQICGLGPAGYRFAIEALVDHLGRDD
jgi:3-dehydroquinate dehydratase-2